MGCISKQYRRRLFAVILSAAAMMAMMLVTDYYIYDIVYGIRDAVFGMLKASPAENAALNEVILLLVQMVIYFLTMILPVIIPAAIYIKRSPVKYKGSKGAAPAVPFVIGGAYIASMIASAVFSGFGDRFDGGATEAVPSTVAGVAVYMIFLALMPAIFEELAFRGVMLRILSPYGKWQAIILSAAIFGSMHINPPQALFAFAFGIMAGWLYMKTGTLLWGMLIHLSVNGLSGISAVTMTYYSEMSPGVVLIGLLALGLMCYALVYIIVALVKHGQNKNMFMAAQLPDIREAGPAKALPQVFKGICFPATAIFVALYVTLLLTRYFPEVIDAMLHITI